MRRGIYLRELGVKTRPCLAERTGEKRFRIVLTQGLNRQIRRMCRACGFQVRSLKRIRVPIFYWTICGPVSAEN